MIPTACQLKGQFITTKPGRVKTCSMGVPAALAALRTARVHTRIKLAHTPCRRRPRPTSCLPPRMHPHPHSHPHPRSTGPAHVVRVHHHQHERGPRYRRAHRAASSVAYLAFGACNALAFQPYVLAVHPRTLELHNTLWSTTRTACSTVCATSHTLQMHTRAWRECATAGGRGGGGS